MIRLLNADGTFIGGLADVVSAVVTEERNGIFELVMTYPVDTEMYQYIQIGTIVETVPRPDADADLFRIYGISKPMNRVVTISAEHISYQLMHIPVSPFSATGVINAMSGLQTYSAEDNPFEFDTDITNAESGFNVAIPTALRSLLGGVSGSMIDTFGGELLFERYSVKLLAHRGHDNGVVLRYGKNITDFSQEDNLTNVKTGLYPYYRTENAYVELPEKVISVAVADNFPFKRTIPIDFTADFDAQVPPTEEELRNRAIAYMTANNFGIPDVSITVSFIDLSKTENYKDFAYLEKVNLCDTVKVIFDPYGIEVSSKVVEVEYNVLTGRYNSITLGNTKPTVQSAMVSAQNAIADVEKNAQSQIEAAILKSTELITGVRGGHVVFSLDRNNKPYEILILDTDDIRTATKVWRWNMNGLGYSSNGYNGQYELAMTMDGRINASMIQTGQLNASLVRTGRISSIDGRNFFDLDTGEAHFEGIQNAISEITDALNLFFTFDAQNGLIIGSGTDATVKLRLQNDNLAFIDALGNALAWMSDKKLYITSARIQSLQVGFDTKLWEITYDHGFSIRRI